MQYSIVGMLIIFRGGLAVASSSSLAVQSRSSSYPPLAGSSPAHRTGIEQLALPPSASGSLFQRPREAAAAVACRRHPTFDGRSREEEGDAIEISNDSDVRHMPYIPSKFDSKTQWCINYKLCNTHDLHFIEE
ncbi:hypothetical protein AXF42_Ash002824 [Apostasia shenzhenica]|uniref:Secreted protein n=1 Tax=Apostasia shenzhenica TaxID=1088818 RepID=A0A2I0A7D5_9ASPA|nr:hypothetical protein AXF42_Ash002824 [Apostasia shenzhenica]